MLNRLTNIKIFCVTDFSLFLLLNKNTVGEILRVSKTLMAYLKRPDLYPELGRKIVKNIFNRKSAFRGKQKTQDWAASQAKTQEVVIENLFGIKPLPFSEVYSEEFKKATQKEKDCPIKMGGPGALELIYYACEFTKAKNVVETGVAYGWSSLAALVSVEKRAGKLYSSDMPYLGQNGDQYVGCIIPENLKKYWKLYRQADRESLPKIFTETAFCDVIHYDSDKSYEGRNWAYEQLYTSLRKGGVFISDDIGDNSAYQDFCDKHSIKTEVIGYEGKYIGVFVK